VQFAVLGGELYVIEANPRASRTVPFVSKAIGIPLAKVACRVMLGERLRDLGLPAEPMRSDHVSVKEAVLPFDRFEGADAVLGPEMRSTGEVMGVARDFPAAFAKAQAAAGAALPERGTAFITVTDSDKAGAVAIAQTLHDIGFRIVATRGTAEAIERMGIPAERLNKVGEGSPHVVDWIERGDVDLVVNTPTGFGARTDGWEIRRAAVARGIPCLTTLSGGLAAARAISAARHGAPPPLSLQELHGGLARAEAAT
jgi:carbamoyl-phosphate synthase large subunit